MSRRRRPLKRPVGGASGKNRGFNRELPVDRSLGRKIDSLLKKAKKTKGGLISDIPAKQRTGSYKAPKKQSIPLAKTRKYPKIPFQFNSPQHLSTGNYLVKIKINLSVIKPSKLESKRDGFGYRIDGVKQIKQEPKKLPGIELLAEYNPNQMPSRNNKAKIHVQTTDGKHKIGLIGQNRLVFSDYIKRIHLKENVEIIPEFTVTLAKAEMS